MEPAAVNCQGISAINCRRIVRPAALDCRKVFSFFNSVFQPYHMCEQQISKMCFLNLFHVPNFHFFFLPISALHNQTLIQHRIRFWFVIAFFMSAFKLIYRTA